MILSDNVGLDRPAIDKGKSGLGIACPERTQLFK